MRSTTKAYASHTAQCRSPLSRTSKARIILRVCDKCEGHVEEPEAVEASRTGLASQLHR